MAEYTANFNLEKQQGNEYINIDGIGANFDKIDEKLGNTARFEIARGTGTAITLAGIELADGHSKTFIASAVNNGSATTVNGKPLYKPGTTTAPKLIAGKAYTVWYDASGDCFFIKASAEGDAVAANVLAGKAFSNDDDTGIMGTMPNNGSVGTITLDTQNKEYVIPKGYHNGLGKVKAVISGLIASVIKAGTTVGDILGTFTSDATAAAGDILQDKTAYAKGNKLTGTMPNNGSKTFTPSDSIQTSGAGYYSGIAVNPRPALSGSATEGNVLAGTTFYNNNYTKRTGTMPNRGAVSQSLPINGSYAIPAGYHNGSGKVTQSIPTKAAQTYTPCTASQTISAGQYLNGAQTIKGDANLIPANILSGKNIFGVVGNVVAGKRFAKGTHTFSGSTDESYYFSFMYTTGTKPFKGLTVSGLTFTPRYIIIVADVITKNYTDHTFYMSDVDIEHAFMRDNYPIILDGVAYINSTGFRLPVNSGGQTYYWIAIE